MHALDILYFALALSVLSLSAAVWFMVIRVSRVLETTEPMLKDMRTITKDMRELETTIKDGIVGKGLALLGALLKKKEVKE